MKSYLCVDPGLTMGVAELVVYDDRPAMLARSFECANEPLLISRLILGPWFIDTRAGERGGVIIEDWEYRHGQPTDARMACEPLGIINYLCIKEKISVIRQRPGFCMSIPSTKKALKPLGYWPETGAGGGHQIQAIRHGLAYITMTARHMPTLEHLHPR